MGQVSQHLIDQISSQVDQHGVVVWYDPSGEYGKLVASLELQGVTICRHRDSFFVTRRECEELLSRQAAPRLLVYVAADRSGSQNALLELEAAGVVTMPGQQPPTRNTRLAVIAKSALLEVLAPDHVESIVRQVEEGVLSLAELDSLASSGGGDSAVIRVVFETTDPVRVALAVLTDLDVGAAIEAKGALAEVVAFVCRATGLPAPKLNGFGELRDRLGRHVLICDLASALPEDGNLRAGLPGLPEADAPLRCSAEVAATWRQRRDLQFSYVAASTAARESLKLDLSGVPRPLLWRIETIPDIDDALLTAIEKEALEAPSVELLEEASNGVSRFWATALPASLERWLLLSAALRVKVMADGMRAQLKEKKGGGAKELARSYLQAPAAGEEPWCGLDTAFRHLEARVRRSDVLDAGNEHDNLERLIADARSAYSETTRMLADQLCSALVSSSFAGAGINQQREFFQQFVAPALDAGKTAVIAVDGLRYEMGRELAAALGEEFEFELHPLQVQLPSVTYVGMAALMPFAHQELELAGSGGKGVDVRVREFEIRSRAARIKYLKETLDQYAVEDLKLDQLTPPAKRIRERVSSADLVFVTSTEELDGLCEAGNAGLAHRLMDDVLVQIRRAIRNLLDLGVETVLVVADHGFLLGQELSEGDKIDPPGGTTHELHRRAWIGKGGAASPSYFRATMKDLGISGDVEIAVPFGLGCFKVAGGQNAYFHGGASPQEIFVPALVVRSAEPTDVSSAQISWDLALGSRTISSPFVSVHITGKQDSLFEVQPPRVRVEVWEGRDLISRVLSATYGYDESTGDTVLELSEDGSTIRPNTVMVQLEPMPSSGMVTVHLVDVDSEARLASKTKVPVSRGGFE